MKFFICSICHNIVELIDDRGVPLFCCGKPMQALIPNQNETSSEKHKPIYTLNDTSIIVNLGKENHPMEEKHYISWVQIETNHGTQRKKLKPTDKPQVIFPLLEDEKIKSIFAYCNIHGLWETKIE